MKNILEHLPTDIQNEIGSFLKFRCKNCGNNFLLENYIIDDNKIVIGNSYYCNDVCLTDFFLYS